MHETAVPWEDVERGYEFAKGRYVPHHRGRAGSPADQRYYLVPEETGIKAFTLLKQALEKTGRAVVAKVAIREKASLCLVRPHADTLALETMFYADEVRPMKDLDLPDTSKVAVSPREFQMAVSLIENLSDTFEVDRYQDEYRAALQKVIEAKVAGAPAAPRAAERAGQVVDLMEALKASIEATRKKPAAREGRPPAKARGAGISRSATATRRRRKTA